MILEILIVVTLFLWFLTLVPVPPLAPYAGASNWLCFVWAVLVTLYLFMPALR